MDYRPIVLTGMPAAGKSTVGELVAARLGRPFVDLDDLIEQLAGAPIPEVFARQGEAGFRDLEHRALALVLAGGDGGCPVVAAGGGLVTTSANRELLAERGLVVWLDVPVEVLVARVEADEVDGPVRPLLTAPGGPADRLRKLHRERLDHYRSTADVVVTDGGDRTAVELAGVVVDGSAGVCPG